MRGIFVTGTDTNVGKTVVAAAIVSELIRRGVSTGAFKPAVSGSVETVAGPVWDDATQLMAALGGRFPIENVAPLRFRAPLAPPLAARLEGCRVEMSEIRCGIEFWRQNCGLLVVEGAGGILCPLTDTESYADFAQELQFSTIIVSRSGLGTINHTLMTLEICRSRGIPVLGVVLNDVNNSSNHDPSAATNAAEIARRGNVDILATIPFGTPPILCPAVTASTIVERVLSGG